MKKIPPTLYYYLSFSLMPILGLLQTKVLTAILQPMEFGGIQLIIPILTWTVIIGGIGAPQYIVRFYSKDGVRAYEEGLCISIATIVVIGLIGCAIFIFFNPGFGELKISIRLVLIFLLAALTQQVVTLVQSLLRVKEQHLFYNIVMICAKVFLVIGVIIGVVWWSESPSEGYLLGCSVASIILLVIITTFSKTNNIWKAKIPSWTSIKQLISYSFPVVFIILMGDLLPNLNRYVIAAELDTCAVAKYAIGCLIAILCFSTLYEPLNTILQPPVFRAWENDRKMDARLIITKYFNMYIIVGLIAGGLVIRFEDVLLCVVANRNYRMPAGCFSILIMSNFLLGIYRFMSIHYHLERNTLELGLFFLLSIIVNFFTAVMFIGKIGLLGAGLSVFFGVAVLTSAVWLRSQKNLRVRLSPGYYIIALIISLFLVFVPTLSTWDMYSPLRWLDAVISFGIAASSAYVLIRVFNKNFRPFIVKC